MWKQKQISNIALKFLILLNLKILILVENSEIQKLRMKPNSSVQLKNNDCLLYI